MAWIGSCLSALTAFPEMNRSPALKQQQRTRPHSGRFQPMPFSSANGGNDGKLSCKNSMVENILFFDLSRRNAGFYNTITNDNARPFPDYQDYIGQPVNDVDRNIVVGAHRFNGNTGILEMNPAARHVFSAGMHRADPVIFG